LAINSANNLDFNTPGLTKMSLGAVGSATYSGILTPAGNTYRLGGGGGDLTVTSALTEPASLVINGNGSPGTVTLTGANTYSGGTTITAGTLQGSTTSLQGNILDNAALVFDQATNGTYAGLLSGNGSFVKQNGGLLLLTGNSAAFAGTTAVTGGTLAI